MTLKKHITVWFVLLSLVSAAYGLDNADYRRTIKTFSSIPLLQPYFKQAYGYAVFPAIGKGGVGVGVAVGEGRVYRNHKYRGRTTMTQLSLGFQLGGQIYSEILFFKDRQAYETFTDETFELDATASAAVLTAGAHATIGTVGRSAAVSASSRSKQFHGAYINGMAIFTRLHGGLMFEAAVGGQRFTFEPAPRP